MLFGHKSHKTWPGSSPFLFSVESIAAFSKSLAEYIRISHPQSRHLNPYRPYPTKQGRFESVKIYMQKLNAFLVKIMLSQKRKLLGPYGVLVRMSNCSTRLPSSGCWSQVHVMCACTGYVAHVYKDDSKNLSLAKPCIVHTI